MINYQDFAQATKMFYNKKTLKNKKKHKTCFIKN